MANEHRPPSVLTLQFSSKTARQAFVDWFLEHGGQEAFEEHVEETEVGLVGLIEYDPTEDCISVDFEEEDDEDEDDGGIEL